MATKRKGKIAKLPKEVRDVVNLMIRDGASYPKVISKLTEMGYPGINEVNMSAWYEGGYKDWEEHMARIEEMKARREFAFEIVKANEGSKLHEAGLQLAASQIYEVLDNFDVEKLKEQIGADPENYAALVNALTKLSKSTLDIEKYKAQVLEQKRKIEAELGKVKKDGLTPETLSKIEEALNLL